MDCNTTFREERSQRRTGEQLARSYVWVGVSAVTGARSMLLCWDAKITLLIVKRLRGRCALAVLPNVKLKALAAAATGELP